MDYTKLFELTGKNAVVVGGGSGIGRECALALAAFGASVTVADRDLPGAQATVAQAPDGTTMNARELDVLDDAQVDSAASELAADVLVFTAATNVRKRILDYSPDEFDRVVALNLRSSFALVQGFGRGMVERGGGSIIGFASMRANVVEPGQSVYAATKAGLVQLLKTAAAEFGPSGVRANAIAPGVVDTPLTAQIKADQGWYDAYAAKGALGRWAGPQELAGAAVYLASDAASFVTGSVLYVDGGWTAVDGRFEPPN